MEVTDEKTADFTVMPHLIDKAHKTVDKVLAEGSYDRIICRKALSRKRIQDCIPTKRKDRIRSEVGGRRMDYR